MAMDWKLKGNKHFQRQELEKAIGCYLIGIESTTESDSDTLRALYSNRANCYYELGNYSQALLDSSECISLMKKKNDIKLEQKNKMRMAKCHWYLHQLEDALQIIQDTEWETNYVKIANKLTRSIQDTKHNSKYVPIHAKIPLIRTNLINPISEYYIVGHDHAMSALSGDQNADEKEESSSHSVSLREVSKVNKDINVFFGGVGDARHVFMTILDVDQQLREMTAPLKVNIVMNDIKPSVLARDVLILVLLHRLGHYKSIEVAKAEYEATLLAITLQYLYFGHVMPSKIAYVLENLIDEMLGHSLEDINLTFPWIEVSRANWTAMQKTYTFWKACSRGQAGPDVHESRVAFRRDTDIAGMCGGDKKDEMKDILHAAREKKAKDVKSQAKEHYLKEGLPEGLKQLKEEGSYCNDEEFLDMFLSSIADDSICDNLHKLPNTRHDDVFLGIFKCLPPPKNSLVEFDKIFQKEFDHTDSLNNCDVQTISTKIDSEWKINPTFVDEEWHTLQQGWFQHMFDPIVDIHAIYNQAYIQVSKKANEYFDHFMHLFWHFGEALHRLTAEREVLRIEISIHSIVTVARDIYSSKEERKIKGLPVLFHRIFASNIPDYVGLLSTLTEFLPILERSSPQLKTFLQHNCLLNTGLWKDVDQYVFSSTSIPSVNDVSKFLGVRFCSESTSIWNEMQWTWEADRPLPSRGELTQWLHQLLLATLLPCKKNGIDQLREEIPMTTALFFRVCTFLVEYANYPVHWISDIIQVIIDGKGYLMTTARFPSKTPNENIGYRENPTRVNLSAFYLEFVTFCSIWRQHIIKPLVWTELPALNDIQKYVFDDLKCTCNSKDSVIFKHNQSINSLGIVLRRDIPDNMPIFMPDQIYEIAKCGNAIHLFSSIEWENLASGEQYLSFWLSTKDFAKYADYYVSLVRTDSWITLTDTPAIKLRNANIFSITKVDEL